MFPAGKTPLLPPSLLPSGEAALTMKREAAFQGDRQPLLRIKGAVYCTDDTEVPL